MSGWHAVVPKKDCPHVNEDNVANPKELEGISVFDPCETCGHKGENWVCLKPGSGKVFCSRYVKAHMVDYYMDNPDHCIVFSFADFSFWCYACDSYIEHPMLSKELKEAWYQEKFGDAKDELQILQKMNASKHSSNVEHKAAAEEEKKVASEVTEMLEQLELTG